MRFFADSNILLYAVSALPDEADKRAIALDLLDRPDLALSTQVSGEFYTQATRISRQGRLSHEAAVEFIADLLHFVIRDITLDLVYMAFAIRARFGLNYWDCAILAAARLRDCEAVYSEDMSATQDYDGPRVINPFAHLPQPA